MKVAFVGKGGSGKTTLSALFCRSLALQTQPVMAFDADINQHLGLTLGLSSADAALIPPLGLEMDRIKDYLRGQNPRIRSTASMVKTTPPGKGSRLLRVTEDNPIYHYFSRQVHDIRLMVTGPLSQEDLGLKCYHSKVGAVELILNHLLDEPGEYVVVDMTAGADSFASGMFTKFDLTFVVVEPTLKSLSVYQQYQHYARDYQVPIAVIGNKIVTEDDLTFLRQQVGDALIGWITQSEYVRSLERGVFLPLHHLEAPNLETLRSMQHAVDRCEKDWEQFYQHTIAFHRKNAHAWANAATGEDLTEQIDPDYQFTDHLPRQAFPIS